MIEPWGTPLIILYESWLEPLQFCSWGPDTASSPPSSRLVWWTVSGAELRSNNDTNMSLTRDNNDHDTQQLCNHLTVTTLFSLSLLWQSLSRPFSPPFPPLPRSIIPLCVAMTCPCQSVLLSCQPPASGTRPMGIFPPLISRQWSR